ncbi:MAG: hypothetical protein WC551_10910 [Patescibacteria group bacterium]
MTTEIVNDRELALLFGYTATDWTFPISYPVYEQAFADWVMRALVRDGVCIGAVFTKDDEIHVSVLPEWRRKWATKGLLKQLIGGQKVTTRVTPGHDYMYGILHRLGFRQSLGGTLVKE